MDIARTKEDILRLNGERATVIGRYRAVERPMRGIVRKERPKDHALLSLSDGVQVYLEAFESPASRRPEDELRRFDGKVVAVEGTVFKFMPASGESPIAPCVSDISDVRETDGDEGGGA